MTPRASIQITVDAQLYAEARELAERAPMPAVVGKVRFGTAGWTDPSLLQAGLFYPRGIKTAKERLGFYAQHFSMVEVDATYYSLLPVSTAERWTEATPDDFVFNIKAPALLTGHPVETSRLPKDLKQRFSDLPEDRWKRTRSHLPAPFIDEFEQRFSDFLEPLQQEKRLGFLLLQFPPWFNATRGNARSIEELRLRWPDLDLAVEFRNKSWLQEERRERVFRMLAEQRMSYVAVDEPDVAIGGVPPVVEVTNPKYAVVRFHGQNAQGWHRGASVQERFNYLYAPAQLGLWAPRVSQLGQRAEQVHVVFNNCVRDFAVVNARDLAALMAERESGAGNESNAVH